MRENSQIVEGQFHALMRIENDGNTRKRTRFSLKLPIFVVLRKDIETNTNKPAPRI